MLLNMQILELDLKLNIWILEHYNIYAPLSLKPEAGSYRHTYCPLTETIYTSTSFMSLYGQLETCQTPLVCQCHWLHIGRCIKSLLPSITLGCIHFLPYLFAWYSKFKIIFEKLASRYSPPWGINLSTQCVRNHFH